MFRLVHANINVLNMQTSVDFYNQALDMIQVRTIDAEGFQIKFLRSKDSDFLLELTQLFEMKRPYNLGDNESHLCFATHDFEGAHARHDKMGCICYENEAMGVYFIEDPDGYWIEIKKEK